MDLVMNVERWDTCGLEGMQKLRWVMMHIARILLGKIGWSLYDIFVERIRGRCPTLQEGRPQWQTGCGFGGHWGQKVWQDRNLPQHFVPWWYVLAMGLRMLRWWVFYGSWGLHLPIRPVWGHFLEYRRQQRWHWAKFRAVFCFSFSGSSDMRCPAFFVFSWPTMY